MAVAYVKSGSGVTVFAQSTAYSTGNRIVPSRADTGTNHQLAKRWVWECTTAGTSAAANPTWPASVTQDTTTVTSGTAVFTARRPGFSSGTTADWTFATIYIDYPWGAGGLNAAGDICYVSSNHSETNTTAIGASPGNALVSATQVLSVNDSAAPPTTLQAGAVLAHTNSFSGNFGATGCYFYGITFQLSGATSYPAFFGVFDTCSIQALYSSGNPYWNVYGPAINCTFKITGAVGARIVPSYISGGSFLTPVTPSAIFGFNSYPRAIVVENFDLSAVPASTSFQNQSGYSGGLIARNCKLPASWTGSLNASGTLALSYVDEMNAVDASGTNYIYRKQMYAGTIYSETTIVRSGGATNGTTALSHKYVNNGNARFPQLNTSGPEIVRWNETTGSSITVTVELIHDSTTSLTNQECWMELSYYGASGSPLGTMVTSAANVVASASNLSASTASWTTTGMTNPNPQKISLTVTPQLKGYLIARVFLAKASKTIYVDPKLTVS